MRRCGRGGWLIGEGLREMDVWGDRGVKSGRGWWIGGRGGGGGGRGESLALPTCASRPGLVPKHSSKFHLLGRLGNPCSHLMRVRARHLPKSSDFVALLEHRSSISLE